MIGPLDPVATKLGQKDEWKRTNTTKHLIGMNKRVIKDSKYKHTMIIGDKMSDCIL